MSRPKAVVCLSGGMDSTVCAALAARDYDSFGLHFSYGQRTQARELKAAREVAKAVGLRELMELETDLFRRIGGSALTDANIAVPDAVPGKPEDDSVRQGGEVPVTYVPFRNAHFLSAAVSWAEVLGAKTVFIGAVEQDSSGYPDCRPEYYQAFNHLLRVGTKEGHIQVRTPLIHHSKADIVRLGLELEAPFPLSWSCYQNSEQACGYCDSCRLRRRAFEQAGASDPIRYAGTAESADATRRQDL